MNQAMWEVCLFFKQGIIRTFRCGVRHGGQPPVVGELENGDRFVFRGLPDICYDQSRAAAGCQPGCQTCQACATGSHRQTPQANGLRQTSVHLPACRRMISASLSGGGSPRHLPPPPPLVTRSLLCWRPTAPQIYTCRRGLSPPQMQPGLWEAPLAGSSLRPRQLERRWDGAVHVSKTVLPCQLRHKQDL